MSASPTSFRLWLTRWFGLGHDTDASTDAPASGKPDQTGDEDGPLFSLGDKKQDVVISYRAPQTDKS